MNLALATTLEVGFACESVGIPHVEGLGGSR